ncbi:hypothetical protein UB46_40675 [Burkholderiaceae bacterium 16]|nr:hypothetical protein UB46_40675 [Burkholderiaceae bacterium 16]
MLPTVHKHNDAQVVMLVKKLPQSPHQMINLTRRTGCKLVSGCELVWIEPTLIVKFDEMEFISALRDFRRNSLAVLRRSRVVLSLNIGERTVHFVDRDEMGPIRIVRRACAEQ